jgi:hypothetical protein
MTPIAFLRRLALLIPKPGQNMLRYQGQFAPNAKHRDQLAKLVPTSHDEQPDIETKSDSADDSSEPTSLTESASPYRIRWAQLLRRVFEIDVSRCTKCGGRRAELDLFEVDTGELAVGAELADFEVDAAVLFVSDAFLHQLGGQRDHVVDVLGGFWIGLGRLDAQGGEVLHEVLANRVGQLVKRLLGRFGGLERAIVEIGDVHHVVHLMAGKLHGAAHEIGDYDAAVQLIPIRSRRLDWASLLQRVYDVDVLKCPRCTGRLEVIAAISEPDIVRRILDHLDLPSTPPQCKPARGPPEDMPLFEN